MVSEMKTLKNGISVKDTRISSLETDVQARDATITSRDDVISSEKRGRAAAELDVVRLTPSETEANDLRPLVAELNTRVQNHQAEIDRLQPFEIEANDLRPQIGTLRDELRSKTREIAGLSVDITRIQGDLEVAYQRFEVVNQRAAEIKDAEKNLRNLLRERDVVLERSKAQYEEQLETLQKKHDNGKELLQQQREEDIEAVKGDVNSELDGIIATKSEKLVLPSSFSTWVLKPLMFWKYSSRFFSENHR